MTEQREQTGDRRFGPTPLRRQRARQRGQVARSGDLTALVVTGGGLLALGLFGPGMMRSLANMTAQTLAAAGQTAKGSAWQAVCAHLPVVLWSTAPLLACLAVLGAAVSMLQVGAVLSAQPLRPDLGRLSLAGGLRRMASLRSAVRVAMAVLKVLAVGLTAYWTIRAAMPRIVACGALDAEGLAGEAWALIAALAVRVGAVLLLLAAGDYSYQRWQHEQDLKMTYRELKDDLRQMEGDPKLRSRRRKAAQERQVNGNV